MTTTTEDLAAKDLALAKFRDRIPLSVNQRRLVALELARRVNQRTDGSLTGDEATGLVERVAHSACPNPHIRFYALASAVEDRDGYLSNPYSWANEHDMRASEASDETDNAIERALTELLTVKHPDRPLALSPEDIEAWHTEAGCCNHGHNPAFPGPVCCVEDTEPCESAIEQARKFHARYGA